MNRTTIEFDRLIANRIDNRDGVRETVNAEVATDGETIAIDIPTPGRWECDVADLAGFLIATLRET